MVNRNGAGIITSGGLVQGLLPPVCGSTSAPRDDQGSTWWMDSPATPLASVQALTGFLFSCSRLSTTRAGELSTARSYELFSRRNSNWRYYVLGLPGCPGAQGEDGRGSSPPGSYEALHLADAMTGVQKGGLFLPAPRGDGQVSPQGFYAHRPLLNGRRRGVRRSWFRYHVSPYRRGALMPITASSGWRCRSSRLPACGRCG